VPMTRSGNSVRSSCGWALLVAVPFAVGSVGCSSDQAPKAWGSLATCLAGDAAPAALAARLQQLRLTQLNHAFGPSGADSWPGSCMKYANELYAGLDSSGKPALLRRRLEEKLSCADGKSSCKLANDEGLVPITTALWESAKEAELPTQVVPAVTKPTAAIPPTITGATWKSFSAKPQRMDGPWLTPDGRALLVTTDLEGKTKPTGCELAQGFSAISCKPSQADVPELPQQTIRLVAEPSGIFATGLLETGMVAYNLQTGKKLVARGSVGRPVINGLAIEEEVLPEPKAPPARAKKRGSASEATPAAPGQIVMSMTDGKASAAVKLPTKAPVLKPITLHHHAIWVEGAETANRVVIKSLSAGRLHDAAAFTGNFKGTFHTCDSEGIAGLAVWDRRAGLAGAKPTGGSGKTQLTVVMWQNGAWTKPIETTIPFDRLTESELHCAKNGVSVVWASRAENLIEIGRVDCTADACKSSQAKLPGVESKWWWLISALGENVVLVWRSGLGDTRVRVAPIASLATVPDRILFDTSDYGGPTNTDARSVVSTDAALLVFTDERPVALRIGKDGSSRVIVP